MGTIRQSRCPRTRSAPEMPPPRRNPRPTDFLLFFGVLFIAAAIGAKAFWRETVPPPVGIDAPEL